MTTEILAQKLHGCIALCRQNKMGPAHHSLKVWAICPPMCRGAGVFVCVYMKVDGVLGGKSVDAHVTTCMKMH